MRPGYARAPACGLGEASIANEGAFCPGSPARARAYPADDALGVGGGHAIGDLPHDVKKDPNSQVDEAVTQKRRYLAAVFASSFTCNTTFLSLPVKMKGDW